MADAGHGYCTLHRIGYNRDMDAMCPQCVRSGQNAEQWDFHAGAQAAVHPTTGNLIDPKTQKEILQPDNSTSKPVKAASV